jgi:hypothetical protein
VCQTMALLMPSRNIMLLAVLSAVYTNTVGQTGKSGFLNISSHNAGLVQKQFPSSIVFSGLHTQRLLLDQSLIRLIKIIDYCMDNV